MLQNANLPCYISSFVVCIFAEVMTNASFQAAKGNEEMLKLRPQKISRQTWIKGGNSSQKFIFFLSPYSYFITLFNYSWKIIEIRGDKFSEANSQRVICFNFQKRSRRRGFQFGMESGRKFFQICGIYFKTRLFLIILKQCGQVMKKCQSYRNGINFGQNKSISK